MGPREDGAVHMTRIARTIVPFALCALALGVVALGSGRTDLKLVTAGCLACVAALILWVDVRLLGRALLRFGRDLRAEDALGMHRVVVVLAPLFTTAACVGLAHVALSLVTTGPALAQDVVSLGAGL